MNSSNGRIMLKVDNLNKKFGDFYAVRNLNFHVNRGEVFGFLGPNGAGKTTTMRIITCFIPATSGSVFIDGIETTQDSLSVRKKIGYLPETTPLYYDMTVREYLSYAGQIRGFKGSRLGSRIDEMFSICGLGNMASRQIGKLSKGYRQRVSLAQAIIHDPDLLILDEPMSGLDPNQIVEIRQLIRKIGKEKTVIYCSHILSEVSATCDRLHIINEGKTVASGTPDELTSSSQKGSRYMARIKGEKGAIENTLSQLPDVNSVELTELDSLWHKADIISTRKDDCGEQIFQCAVDNGWGLAELRRESASLEEVFTQLTRS